MIIEYIRYGLSDEAQARRFERDYAQAAKLLDASPHCLGYHLSRCVEQPLQYVLQIRWDSVEGHLQGFRQSAAFADFVGLVGGYMKQLLEMRHYAVTSVVSEAAPPARG